MRWLASDLVPEVVDKVDLPAGASSMLDVGGSHGLYTAAFCEKHADLTGTDASRHDHDAALLDRP